LPLSESFGRQQQYMTQAAAVGQEQLGRVLGAKGGVMGMFKELRKSMGQRPVLDAGPDLNVTMEDIRDDNER
jgi:hypothetical protein